MLWDIELIFGMWVYSDKLQIKFTFHSGPMIFGSYDPWTLKFGQIFSCHYFFSLCLEILIWCLVYECIMMSYRSSLQFVPVQWFLAELWPLSFEIWRNILLSPLYFTMIWDIDLIFGMRVYNHKLQINFEIHPLFLAYYWVN